MRNHHAKAATGLLLIATGAALFLNLRAGEIASANEKTPSRPVAVLGKPFEVKVGTSTVIPAQKLDVHFERVLADSRCPKDVDCVWAGQITVEVGMKKADDKLGITQLTVQGSRIVSPKSIGKIGPYGVKLVEVAPERETRSSGSAQRIRLVVQTKPFAAPKNGK